MIPSNRGRSGRWLSIARRTSSLKVSSSPGSSSLSRASQRASPRALVSSLGERHPLTLGVKSEAGDFGRRSGRHQISDLQNRPRHVQAMSGQAALRRTRCSHPKRLAARRKARREPGGSGSLNWGRPGDTIRHQPSSYPPRKGRDAADRSACVRCRWV